MTSIYDIAKKLRQNMTPAEKILWARLRDNRLGKKFRRQTAFIFGAYRYVADFCCQQLKLIIEIDGDVHDLKEVKEYDGYREDIFQDAGYQALRLKNSEVPDNIEKVLNTIQNKITGGN